MYFLKILSKVSTFFGGSKGSYFIEAIFFSPISVKKKILINFQMTDLAFSSTFLERIDHEKANACSELELLVYSKRAYVRRGSNFFGSYSMLKEL